MASNIVRKNQSAESSNKAENSNSSQNTFTENVLNKYRSYTYNFTIFAIRRTELTDLSYKKTDENLDLVVLKSSGKGSKSNLSTNVTPVQKRTNVKEQVLTSSGWKETTEVSIENDSSGKALVESFNKNSPGRFDFFIDNVEINTTMGFSQESSTTIPTTIKFEVFEPYGINGFIESLHVSAVAAGYPSYPQAKYGLKMSFLGYPDDKPVEQLSPEKIDKSERYFIFSFTGLEVEVTERGTRYRCTAVPYSELGFGQSNVTKKPGSASGSTVQELLSDFMTNLTRQMIESNKAGKEGENTQSYSDVYEIKFPSSTETVNAIGQAKVLQPLKENTLYKFFDSGSAGASGYDANGTKPNNASPKRSLINSKPTINFFNNAAIHEIIAAVIRDSEYLRNKLQNIKENIVDEMFDYFLISIDIEDTGIIDEQSRRFYKKYTYIVVPYKIHRTKIPNYAGQTIDSDSLKKRVLREYNYIYTGKNVDILNFKLNFNTLYFEAIPYALGNNERPGSKDLASVNAVSRPKLAPENIKKIQINQIPVPTQEVVPYNTVPVDGKAGQLLDDPYSILAINLHEAVVNSKASMITGEINIVGDPLYLVNTSNSDITNTDVITSNGEAAHKTGDLLITINFNNPVDVGSLENGGWAEFQFQKVPFSGIYKVIRVQSQFREGQFTQKLEIIRIPGQSTDNQTPSDPAEKVVSKVDNEVVY